MEQAESALPECQVDVAHVTWLDDKDVRFGADPQTQRLSWTQLDGERQLGGMCNKLSAFNATARLSQDPDWRPSSCFGSEM